MNVHTKLECLTVPSKLFHLSLMFASKAGAANIKLAWEGLPGTNTPAYYKHL
jgi:hypothetical protein